MKILIIRFSALGDVAMVAPVIKELAEQMPEMDITIMSLPFCKPIFDGLADNVHFLGKDVRKDYKGMAGLWRLFRELHGMGFDCVCDLHDVLRTKVLRKLFHIYGYRVVKIDKLRKERRKITAPEGIKELRPMTTSFEKYRRALKEAVAEVGDFTLPDIDGIVPERTDKNRFMVGIAPFAAHEGKIYPLQLMERVIELLKVKSPDCRVILFGGGGKEREKMLEWSRLFPNNVVTARDVIEQTGDGGICKEIEALCDFDGKKGLSAELELMKHLDCMVSMDSANMHLASLVGIRVVSIWGATHPFAGFLGWRQSMDDCVQVRLSCRPCSIYGNKPCARRDMACMRMINPDDVVSKIICGR